MNLWQRKSDKYFLYYSILQKVEKTSISSVSHDFYVPNVLYCQWDWEPWLVGYQFFLRLMSFVRWWIFAFYKISTVSVEVINCSGQYGQYYREFIIIKKCHPILTRLEFHYCFCVVNCLLRICDLECPMILIFCFSFLFPKRTISKGLFKDHCWSDISEIKVLIDSTLHGDSS